MVYLEIKLFQGAIDVRMKIDGCRQRFGATAWNTENYEIEGTAHAAQMCHALDVMNRSFCPYSRRHIGRSIGCLSACLPDYTAAS